jgi:hypothetical protein
MLALAQLAVLCLNVPLSRRAFVLALPTAAVVPHAVRALPSPSPTIPAGTAIAAAAAAPSRAPSAAVEFYSGLLAGAVQKTVKELALHPLDTAKARLQLAGGRRAALSELFAAPYAGLVPALVAGAPAASGFFAVKDAVKRAVAPLGLGREQTTLVAVVCANVAYWGIKNPSEVLKVRRQAGVDGDTLAAAREVWAAEGALGFYKSAPANFAYSTPVDTLKFVLYEALKSELKAQRGGAASLSAVEAALGGAAAASTAQALATPLDVARVRIITSNEGGVLDTIRAIIADEGVPALYAGVVPKVARALCSGAIQFSTYEATKAWSVELLARRFPGL